MAGSPQRYYDFLVESLRLIAASAAVQKASVDEDALVMDDITMTFAMAYPYVGQLARDGFLSHEALKTLAPIHDWIWLDVEADVYFPESLSRHPHWANGRRLAARALNLMREEVRPPKLDSDLCVSFDLNERQDS